MGCQQSRNTVPTEYLDPDDHITNHDEDPRVKNLFQNIQNNLPLQGNFIENKMHQQVPQAKGSEAPQFDTTGVSKKFNESRTLDLINNELFSNRLNQQSVRESKKNFSSDKENASILQEYRQIKLKKSISMQQSQQQNMNQQNMTMKQYNTHSKNGSEQYQNQSVKSSKDSLSSAISSQLQMRFQSTLKDTKKQLTKGFENNWNETGIKSNSQSIQKLDNPRLQQYYNQHMIDSARQIMSIRSGKSIQLCSEEYECISYMILEKVIPQMMKSGSQLMKFRREIVYLIEKWGESVHSAVIEQTGEIRNFVSLRNTNDFIRITHELSCWKKFSVLERFVTNILKQPLNSQYLEFVKNNAQQIKALSSFIWIEFSFQKDTSKLDVQIGVSEKQPYDSQLLHSIIQNKSERTNILDWYEFAQPIANEYGFIVNSQHIDEIFDFYVFENDENTNLNSSLQAFYNYGATFSPAVVDLLSRIPGNDFHVLFHLNKFGLLNLKLSLQNLWGEEESVLFDEITLNSDSNENYDVLRRAWEQFNQTIFNEENIFIIHMLELNPDGYYIYKTREVSIDEDIQI